MTNQNRMLCATTKQCAIILPTWVAIKNRPYTFSYNESSLSLSTTCYSMLLVSTICNSCAIMNGLSIYKQIYCPVRLELLGKMYNSLHSQIVIFSDKSTMFIQWNFYLCNFTTSIQRVTIPASKGSISKIGQWHALALYLCYHREADKICS